MVDAFRRHFGAERVRETGPARRARTSDRSEPNGTRLRCSGSSAERTPDIYAKAKEADRLNELPVNHSPKFAPSFIPTLQTGVETLVVAAHAWLGRHKHLRLGAIRMVLRRSTGGGRHVEDGAHMRETFRWARRHTRRTG